jgi:hypothetical protein
VDHVSGWDALTLDAARQKGSSVDGRSLQEGRFRDKLARCRSPNRLNFKCQLEITVLCAEKLFLHLVPLYVQDDAIMSLQLQLPGPEGFP